MADKKQETTRPTSQRPMEQKGLVTDVLVPLAGSGLSGYVGAKVGQGARKDK
jgi:hypothetical protein